MNIHPFRFGYTVPSLTPEQRTAAQPHVREQLPEDTRYHTFHGDVLALARALPGIEITITGTDVPATTWETIVDRLSRIEARIADARPVVNERCNVAVPGLGLMAIREVCVELDLCTDRLDELLVEGWRILAICPQPDQRRPDYVLGRNERRDTPMCHYGNSWCTNASDGPHECAPRPGSSPATVTIDCLAAHDAKHAAEIATLRAPGPVRGLTCCVCGEYAGRWHQHWNRDDGYGICRKCVDWCKQQGETDEEIRHSFGVEGVNYAPAGTRHDA